MSIVVVSGLPRSGTSLAMQMLAAAGFPILTDRLRVPDPSNPKGYFEWERIKQLPRDPRLIAEAEGQAVKVVSALLPSLPRGFDYRVLFLERDLAEIAASQKTMLERSGAPTPPGNIEAVLAAHRRQLDAVIASRSDFHVLRVRHRELVNDPHLEAAAMARFLQLDPDAATRMAGEVDTALWRARARKP